MTGYRRRGEGGGEDIYMGSSLIGYVRESICSQITSILIIITVVTWIAILITE